MDLFGILQAIYDFIVNGVSGVINTILSIGEWFNKAILWIIDTIISAVQWVGNAIGTILHFFGDLIIAVVNIGIQLFGGLFNVIFMTIQTSIHFVIDMVNNIIKVIDIVRMVIEVGLAIAGKVFLYLGQVIQLAIGILNGINGAPITPVSGLPRCISAPLQSDWCAIWYVTDWTIFAPGTPGAFLIPVIVLIIDLFIIAYIVRSIFKLVRWFQSIYRIA